jgi:hypothetical protein
MKHYFLIAIAFCIVLAGNAQNVGIGTSTPNANAKLDITATDKGLLIPRMDSVHRKAIPNTAGLLVYDSSTSSFWYSTGTAWQNMATTASGWSLTGNSGTDTSINFLGTTDNTALLFKINNQPAGIIYGNSANGTTSIGFNAFSNLKTIGTDVTAFGQYALHSNVYQGSAGGGENAAVGSFALSANTTGSVNTALGALSLGSNTTASANTAVGAEALFNNNGPANSALGYRSLYYNSGASNTGIGYFSLSSNGNGNYNTAVGANTLVFNGSNSGNTVVGYNALFNVNGSYNTALGYNAAFSSNAPFSNATAIGANATVDASNKIRLGDANVTVVESNGVFNTVSDGRFKYNIRENVKGLDFILQLRPVTYQFDTKKQEDFIKGNLTAEQLNKYATPAAYNESSNIKRTGFIAQEVAAAAQKTGYDFDGVKIPANDKQYYSLSYASFVVPLVKAVQEQQQTIDALKKQNELLQQQNELMMKRLEALEKK